MQTESLGKELPRILFPYVHQWAERSGLTFFSKLLVDDDFRALIEKYGNELVMRMTESNTPASEWHAPEVEVCRDALRNLRERVSAMEAQHEAQQAFFEFLRSKVRPLALALGCCPECLVGVEGCPKCLGRSQVAHYAPDYTLLVTEVVTPLAARGVPLVLNEKKVSRTSQQSKELSATRKRSKSWPKR